MWKKSLWVKLFFILFVLSFPVAGTTQEITNALETKGKITGSGPAALWRSPEDIASRNLFYGSGGKQDEPHPPFTFLKEDLSGTSPKFEVLDQDEVKWKVKLGAEARSETVAARLLWAVGYFTDEDYFLSNIRVEDMPRRLKRGQGLVEPGGLLQNVRLERAPKGKKIGAWQWRHNPFTGTRELNGLRVMMALINNWDLKNQNTAVYILSDGVKGGVKLDHSGGAKPNHFGNGEGFVLLDLQGWLERRPAPRFSGARLGRSGRHPCRSRQCAGRGRAELRSAGRLWGSLPLAFLEPVTFPVHLQDVARMAGLWIVTYAVVTRLVNVANAMRGVALGNQSEVLS